MWSRLLVVLFLSCASSCGADPEPDIEVCSSALLFGRPSASTGLNLEQCAPSCSCQGETWAPVQMAPEARGRLLEFQLTTPVELLSANPYDDPASHPEPSPSAVCAVSSEGDGSLTYELTTFESAAAARAAGSVVTHSGNCGLCSSLSDLAAYAAHPDLTDPVRDCGVRHITSTMDRHVECLRELGFSLPCAQIWYYNTIHTGSLCSGVCLSMLDAPHHQPDGSLNACLVCDEEMSGAVFKSVAGRTRRNTGLASAICRPCETVQRIDHVYE